MTYEQELLKKKEKAEAMLIERMDDRRFFANRVGEEVMAGFDPSKANLEDVEIEIEALQEFIERIDSYLKEKAIESQEEVEEPLATSETDNH